MSVLLDSDVIIQLLRGQDSDAISIWTSLVSSELDLFFSPVTAAEIWAGSRPGEIHAIAEFFDHLLCIPTDYDIGCLAGKLMREFSRSHDLKLGDALIAATAIQLNATLWTRNRKHYPMPALSLL